MSEVRDQDPVQQRLAAMDERLAVLQAELEADLGEDEPVAQGPPVASAAPPPSPVPSAPPRTSSPEPPPAPPVAPARRAPRIFPPRPGVGRRRAAPAPPATPPPRATAAPAPPAAPPPRHALDPAQQMAGRLLAAVRELLAGYEIALAQISREPAGPAVTLAAGPFRGLEMLEQFERALSELPQVASVARRGFEGHDRAIVEVQLRG
ncbi:MAG TPA: hypothetical protein VE992_02990 [Solirubrobacteraceae bacterium]|nr:hypothetical protein [Solirubrobacteraceae bacterium]